MKNQIIVLRLQPFNEIRKYSQHPDDYGEVVDKFLNIKK